MAHEVIAVIYDGFELLDLSGPSQVFAIATALAGESGGYRVRTAAPGGGQVPAFGGVRVVADLDLARLPRQVDTLVVCGGFSSLGPLTPPLVSGVRALARRAGRTTSVCSGAFLLAEAGLLDGRQVTTHWAAARELARRYPEISVEPDRIYVQDGPLWTSAGVTAGIDLALALVAADHGSALAREVARWLVVYLQRPGGQSQFSAPLSAVDGGRDSYRELRAFLEENPAADLSLPALAARAGTSVRHFSRTFTAEVGVSPGRYVEQVRLAAARRLLENTDDTLEVIARTTGLGSPETLYRVFLRGIGVSPGAYRRRFRCPATVSA